MKTELQVSVRDLVYYSLRSGDLDLTTFGKENPLKAIRAHQKIQRSRPNNYEAEVTLSHKIETDSQILIILGRMDGIYRFDSGIVIDEIKTTKKPLSNLTENDNPHYWGQAMCYAYIYSVQNKINDLEIQLTYYNIEDNNIREFKKPYQITGLSEFFSNIIGHYLKWAKIVDNWKNLRNNSIPNVQFPFPGFRPGQETIIMDIKKALHNSSNILIEAPTGIGKTMAAVFPAIKSLLKNKKYRIFFLTARTTGSKAAEKTIDILREKGLRLKYLCLTAKEKACFKPGVACNGMECEYARGFYDRINNAVQDSFINEAFTFGLLKNIAERHMVCPFELSLELALWVDFIICDYNYVFDPRVYLRRFFENEDLIKKHVLLIDEAHNLVDRSRDMFSAALNKKAILILRRALKNHLPHIYSKLGKLNSFFLKSKKNIQGKHLIMENCPEELPTLLLSIMHSAEKWLSLNIQATYRKDLLAYYFEVRKFVNTLEMYDKDYKTYFQKTNDDIYIRLFCIDPSRLLSKIFEKQITSIFLSATLSPSNYFLKIFGCSHNTSVSILTSPFKTEQLCTMIIPSISVLYKHREKTKNEIAIAIYNLVNQKRGNYLVFFPSYSYMDMVDKIYCNIDQDSKVSRQSPSMCLQERQLFLDQFSSEKTNISLLGFAVMGGFFSESIDLVGDRLTGAVIIGVGFPQICIERDIIKDYYTPSGKGLLYSYQIPGMIKVLQSAGRVIRSEQDKGIIMLIDSRYILSPYRYLLPKHWQIRTIYDKDKIKTISGKFWKM